MAPLSMHARRHTRFMHDSFLRSRSVQPQSHVLKREQASGEPPSTLYIATLFLSVIVVILFSISLIALIYRVRKIHHQSRQLLHSKRESDFRESVATSHVQPSSHHTSLGSAPSTIESGAIRVATRGKKSLASRSLTSPFGSRNSRHKPSLPSVASSDDWAGESEKALDESIQLDVQKGSGSVEMDHEPIRSTMNIYDRRLSRISDSINIVVSPPTPPSQSPSVSLTGHIMHPINPGPQFTWHPGTMIQPAPSQPPNPRWDSSKRPSYPQHAPRSRFSDIDVSSVQVVEVRPIMTAARDFYYSFTQSMNWTPFTPPQNQGTPDLEQAARPTLATQAKTGVMSLLNKSREGLSKLSSSPRKNTGMDEFGARSSPNGSPTLPSSRASPSRRTTWLDEEFEDVVLDEVEDPFRRATPAPVNQPILNPLITPPPTVRHREEWNATHHAPHHQPASSLPLSNSFSNKLVRNLLEGRHDHRPPVVEKDGAKGLRKMLSDASRRGRKSRRSQSDVPIPDSLGENADPNVAGITSQAVRPLSLSRPPPTTTSYSEADAIPTPSVTIPNIKVGEVTSRSTPRSSLEQVDAWRWRGTRQIEHRHARTPATDTSSEFPSLQISYTPHAFSDTSSSIQELPRLSAFPSTPYLEQDVRQLSENIATLFSRRSHITECSEDDDRRSHMHHHRFYSNSDLNSSGNPSIHLYHQNLYEQQLDQEHHSTWHHDHPHIASQPVQQFNPRHYQPHRITQRRSIPSDSESYFPERETRLSLNDLDLYPAEQRRGESIASTPSPLRIRNEDVSYSTTTSTNQAPSNFFSSSWGSIPTQPLNIRPRRNRSLNESPSGSSLVSNRSHRQPLARGHRNSFTLADLGYSGD